MAEILKLYLIAAISFSIIDFVWLGFVAKKLYRRYLGDHLSEKPNLTAAIAFYVLFLVGLLIFVIVPAHDQHTAVWAVGYGALFGFFTYITYDLTNLATLKNWPVSLTMIDIVWGSALSAAVAGLTVLLA